jgi:opacity protein-like surface antigen
MHYIASGFAAMLLLLSLSGALCAEEGDQAAAGLKIVMSEWHRDIPDAPGRTSGIGALVGWAAEADYSNGVYLEASYLVSALDYKFDQTAVTTELERNDVEFLAGYQFSHRLGVFAGYRSSQFRDLETKDKETLHGPLIGAQGSLALNEVLSLFGKLTYLPWSTRATYAAADEKETALGWFASAGIKYVFTRRITGALGYQHETTRGRESRITDTFSGATFKLMYSF